MKSRFTNNFAFTIKAVFLLIDNNFCKSKSYLNYSDFHLHKCLLTRKLRILEIGVGGGENTKYGGNSLKMWAKYFPKSEVLGIDLYDKSLLDYRRIQTFQGSQSDEKFLSQFEIIIFYALKF